MDLRRRARRVRCSNDAANVVIAEHVARADDHDPSSRSRGVIAAFRSQAQPIRPGARRNASATPISRCNASAALTKIKHQSGRRTARTDVRRYSGAAPASRTVIEHGRPPWRVTKRLRRALIRVQCTQPPLEKFHTLAMLMPKSIRILRLHGTRIETARHQWRGPRRGGFDDWADPHATWRDDATFRSPLMPEVQRSSFCTGRVRVREQGARAPSMVVRDVRPRIFHVGPAVRRP